MVEQIEIQEKHLEKWEVVLSQVSHSISNLNQRKILAILIIGDFRNCGNSELFSELKRYNLVKYPSDVSRLLADLMRQNLIVKNYSGRSYRLTDLGVHLYKFIDKLLPNDRKRW